ncbi:hypothetical protein BAUCODRAFT_144411 [Baudoinia panamericana UAMH 10762]|uniref:ATP-dependent DNA helicase n=1 Tax=Baudoinia panamericana (strain UAMH 10762) TaxID=717646 RepID=M2NMP1_BAUPA|nr:uncharacterized protein BAUCODRAFT_144411 [Baudoinia panamericana UAMH 10762]EMD00800.1 hypothetical protein BAUCODRAFT_144411 [Baudoinia panamericana UAMH 10762]
MSNAADDPHDFDSDAFDLNSVDEAELISVQDNAVQQSTLKRKSGEPYEPTTTKRLRVADHETAVFVANSTLKTRFGLDAFRLKQEAAIVRTLGGESCVVVFPTGGGKSLCYQVPALCFKEMDRSAGLRQGHAESGITLVVSPLIALMKDQVDALQRRGISAAALDSSRSKQEYMAIVDSMRNGTLDILYCAPERLNNEGFVGSMSNVKGGVRLLAIDEAHCISEWGHAFRPDYLKVARFAKEIQAERVVCLTATATPAVARDVCKAFGIAEEGLFRTATYRPNLRLLAKSYRTKKESHPDLTKFLKAHPGPTIIYVTLQRHTEELAQDLRKNGVKARHFHAGMPAAEKSVCQEAFMAASDVIIVATIAFGMGIDKANIRNVIHYDIPRSLEGYSQEIGRAGRDGLPSQCMLFLCAEGLHLRESFARGDLPSKQSVAALLNELFSLRPNDLGCIEVNLYHQAKEHDIKNTTLKNIYARLELQFGLLRETTPKYTKYEYVELGPLKDDNSRTAQIVRAGVRKAKTLTHVDVDAVARSSGLERSEIVAKLQSWHDSARIDLRTGGVLNMYRVLKTLPTVKAEKERIVNAVYTDLQGREQQELDRMQQVIDLVNGTACFSKSLAGHFGDMLPSGANACGHCTWCEMHTPVKVVTPEPKPFNYDVFEKVLKAVSERDDARFLARVAFGISSPRITQAKLTNSPVFGSMEDYDFTVLLKAFESACSSANQKR